MATVNYIPCKKQRPASLAGVSNYVKQEKKTLLREQNRLLISGQNCLPQFSHLEFLATRDQFRKESPIFFYHYTQSFHPEEPVTGELAHTIAQEFAARAWPENEVLIATHMDAAHIHSHFIVNAVCETGKMLHHGPDNLRHLRGISDEICAAHQLSVLTSPKKRTDGMSSREYRSAVKGQSWKLQMMNVIDQCMCVSGTKEDFKQALRSCGYDLVWTDDRKYITYITPGSKRCRCSKLHNVKYTKEMMELEFRIRAEALHGRAQAYEPAARPHAVDTAGACAAHRHSVCNAGGNGANRKSFEDAGGTKCMADRVPPQALRETACKSDTDTDGRTFESSNTSGADGRTGWETEREVFFSSQAQAFSPGVAYGIQPDIGLGGSSVASALVQVGRRLELLQSAEPVRDSTTSRPHSDSKELRRIRDLKVARGQKEDDHEAEQNYNNTMQQTM